MFSQKGIRSISLFDFLYSTNHEQYDDSLYSENTSTLIKLNKNKIHYNHLTPYENTQTCSCYNILLFCLILNGISLIPYIRKIYSKMKNCIFIWSLYERWLNWLYAIWIWWLSCLQNTCIWIIPIPYEIPLSHLDTPTEWVYAIPKSSKTNGL